MQHLADYKIVKLGNVEMGSVRLAGPPAEMPDPVPPLSDAVLQKIRTKERQEVHKEMAKADNIGLPPSLSRSTFISSNFPVLASIPSDRTQVRCYSLLEPDAGEVWFCSPHSPGCVQGYLAHKNPHPRPRTTVGP